VSSKACKQYRAEFVRERRERWEQEQRDRGSAEWRVLPLDRARAYLCGVLLGREASPELWQVPDWCVGMAA
jgi:hypothetical protein